MTSLYGFQVLHGKIQDWRRMRQCTAGDVVNTDLGELSETILVHVAGSLEFRFALGHSNGLCGHLVGPVRAQPRRAAASISRISTSTSIFLTKGA